MPVSTTTPPNLLSLINVAVAPVVLISATTILLSCYTAKYSAIGGQLRDLASEFRRADTPPERRRSIQRELRLFQRRIAAMWSASISLSLALLCFLITVLSVIFAERATRIGILGALSLICGLLLIVGAVLLELEEIRLARCTVREEVADILGTPPERPSTVTTDTPQNKTV